MHGRASLHNDAETQTISLYVAGFKSAAIETMPDAKYPLCAHIVGCQFIEWYPA